MSHRYATRDPIPEPCGGRLALVCVFVSWLAVAPVAWTLQVQNPTGLPLYPNLTTAIPDNVFRTDLLGHWCMHLSAQSADSLGAVQNWYRRALARDSETDLSHDSAYGSETHLDGIKLTHNLDSVAIYRVARSAATFIELTRCSPVQ